MNLDILQVAKERVTANYVAKAGFSGIPVGFDPTIIITIITTLLSLCKKPAADLKEAGSTPTWAQRVVVKSQVRRELRAQHGPFSYQEFKGDAITDAIFATAAESSEEEIGQMMECC